MDKTHQTQLNKATKLFGTDGIRGAVGVHDGEGITVKLVAKIGWAIGRYLAEKAQSETHQPTVIIGKDTRISGYMLESALQAGLISSGVNVILLGPMPTPGIAYLTRTRRADVGIAITASHNLSTDNGLKFFNRDGEKFDESFEEYLKTNIDSDSSTASDLGQARRMEDATGRYIEFCKSAFPKNLSLEGLKIVLDCAHGAAYKTAPQVLEELGAEVIALGVEPNGHNINDDCGSTKVENLIKPVKAQKADLGLALDGDGDRVMAVSPNGLILNGDHFLWVLANYWQKINRLKGKVVVGTLMSNQGLADCLKSKLNIDLVRSKVGDKFVKQAMIKHQTNLGGESSGHIICSDDNTIGDGIIVALRFLEALIAENHSADEAVQSLTIWHSEQAKIKLKGIMSEDEFNQNTRLQNIIQSITSKQAKLRFVIRPAGTEPLLRILVEGEGQEKCIQICQQLTQKISEYL